MENWADLWLDSIRKLDLYDLDIKRYFSKGVSKFKIKENTVTANVAVDENESHEVEIIFKEFTKKEKEKINSLIDNNPIILSKIYDDKIPEELFECGIPILPVSVNDFKIKCSCVSASLFCRGVTSVLHTLRSKIYYDPFLIFSLRGLDISRKESYQIKSLDDVLSKDYDKYGSAGDFKSGELDNLFEMNKILLGRSNIYYHGSGFSRITLDFLERVNSTLRWNDISEEYYRDYIGFKGFPKNLISCNSQMDKEKRFRDKWDSPRNWDDNFNVDINDNYIMSSCDPIKKSPRALFAFFMELGQCDIEKYPQRLQFIEEILMYTLSLIENYSIVSEVFQLGNGNACVRWIPELVEDKVRVLFEHYSMLCPADLITHDGELLSSETQIMVLISLFVSGIFDYFIKETKFSVFKEFKKSLPFQLLFIKSQKINTYHRMRQVLKIDKWISIFHLKELEYNYALKVIKNADNFKIEIKINKNGKYIDVDEFTMDELRYAEFIFRTVDGFSLSFYKYFSDEIVFSLFDFKKFNEKIKPALEKVGVEFI